MDSKTIMDEILKLLVKVERDGMHEFMDDFLGKSDFFTAPASTQYHSSFEGGLALHSLNVYRVFTHKNKIFKLGLSTDTVAICGLLHDVCKANFYVKDFRNVKENDVWVKKEIYKVEDSFPYGHGEKSVLILQHYMELDQFEQMAIRWHMGFTEPKESWLAYQNALDMYPGIICLHTADLEASKLMEKKKE